MLELSVAAAIMVSLTAIATPSVLKFMQDGQVDEAKALLNTAIAECLSKKNQGITPGNEYTPESLAIGKPLPGKYTYEGELNANKTPNCAYLKLEDTTDEISRLTTLIASIDKKGMVTKQAVAKHPDSKKNCSQWGGEINCIEGGAVEQLRQKAAADALEQARLAKIEQDYSNWLKAGSTGCTDKGDTRKCAFKGREVADQAAIDALVEAEVGKLAMDNYKAWLGNPPSKTGCYTSDKINRCAYKGTEVADQTAVDTAIYNEELGQFNAKLQEAKTNKTDGKVTLNGHTKWTYNGNEFANEAEYTAAKPVPVAPVVATPTQVVTQQPARPSCPWPSPWDKYFC